MHGPAVGCLHDDVHDELIAIAAAPTYLDATTCIGETVCKPNTSEGRQEPSAAG